MTPGAAEGRRGEHAAGGAKRVLHSEEGPREARPYKRMRGVSDHDPGGDPAGAHDGVPREIPEIDARR